MSSMVDRRKAKRGLDGHQDAQLVVRLPQELLDRLDAYAERMRTEMPGARFKRAEAVRVLLTRSLDESEQKRGRR